VIRLAGRDRVRGALAASGIETGIHYPVPIHLQPAHRGRVRVPFAPAVAERLAAEILSLPLYPQMTHAQQDRVVAELARARAAA
jgi:dTDP-4-amino-4,6-dideoxygalactose transaminase